MYSGPCVKSTGEDVALEELQACIQRHLHLATSLPAPILSHEAQGLLQHYFLLARQVSSLVLRSGATSAEIYHILENKKPARSLRPPICPCTLIPRTTTLECGILDFTWCSACQIQCYVATIISIIMQPCQYDVMRCSVVLVCVLLQPAPRSS